MPTTIFPLPTNTHQPACSQLEPGGALAIQLWPALPATRELPPLQKTSLPGELVPTSSSHLPSVRCSAKGCVYPARSAEHIRCAYHELLHSGPEVKFFQSRQPSALLALYAPFEISEEESESEGDRRQDRQRMAAERASFLAGGGN